MVVGESGARGPLDDERIGRRLTRIRELLARWAELRPGIGKAWDHDPSPVPEAEVVALERRAGLRLPENYRRYLLEFGGPGTLLMAYAAQPLPDQPEPRSAEPFPLDAPWAGSAREITEWEAQEGNGDFFADGPGEFYGQFDDPRTAFRDLPPGTEYSDGTLTLGATRSHFLARLVLNGPWSGTVWFDSFGYDGGLIHLADDTDESYARYTLDSFCDADEWLPLADLPWFPALPEGVPDPAPGDFLDLTLAVLRHRVRLAEAERACDALDLPALLEAAERLRTPHDFGFPRGHRYGGFGPYITGLVRDALLAPAPDPATTARVVRLSEALLNNPASVSVALTLAGRWTDLLTHERQAFPEAERSALNIALAATMLDEQPPAPAPDAPPSRLYTPLGLWTALDALTRLTPPQRTRLLTHLPVADATRLTPLLATATLPLTPAALDALLTSDLSTPPTRAAAMVTLLRALRTVTMARDLDDAPPAGPLTDRACALAAALDRTGDVFPLLAAAAPTRWPDWQSARAEGHRHLAALRAPTGA
ncbi:SMI1/KNR4 family protein [Streptomyces sp. NPDC086091]|uniref:SMI1/KNR4 family protein n=1 Tax=Streptomyces sp. NPDC086091 TaxID=3365751 RepID=UPI00382EADBF